MKRFQWQFRLGLALLALSALLFGITYVFTGDLHALGAWFLQSLAFLPLEVLLVAIILSELLRFTERRHLQEKMNVLVGVFFSEMGTRLLKLIISFDLKEQELQPDLQIRVHWSDRDFASARSFLQQQDFHIDSQHGDLGQLRGFLSPQKSLLLQFLGNPLLSESESFTDLIWSITHVVEELEFRSDLKHLSPPDAHHISTDIERVYRPLIRAWLEYMRHLSRRYPYLYSLAVRTNPFDPHATVEIPERPDDT
jgi:hypothetical protein